MSKSRPFAISEVVVKAAYRRVKANKGVNGHLKVRGFGQLKVRTPRLLSPP